MKLLYQQILQEDRMSKVSSALQMNVGQGESTFTFLAHKKGGSLVYFWLLCVLDS